MPPAKKPPAKKPPAKKPPAKTTPAKTTPAKKTPPQPIISPPVDKPQRIDREAVLEEREQRQQDYAWEQAVEQLENQEAMEIVQVAMNDPSVKRFAEPFFDWQQNQKAKKYDKFAQFRFVTGDPPNKPKTEKEPGTPYTKPVPGDKDKKIEPFAHQLHAMEMIVNQPPDCKGILGLTGTGTGKTLLGVLAADHYRRSTLKDQKPVERIFFVTTKTVKFSYGVQQTVEDWGVPPEPFYLLSHDDLLNRMEDPRDRKRLTELITDQILILDEAHMFRNADEKIGKFKRRKKGKKDSIATTEDKQEDKQEASIRRRYAGPDTDNTAQKTKGKDDGPGKRARAMWHIASLFRKVICLTATPIFNGIEDVVAMMKGVIVKNSDKWNRLEEGLKKGYALERVIQNAMRDILVSQKLPIVGTKKAYSPHTNPPYEELHDKGMPKNVQFTRTLTFGPSATNVYTAIELLTESTKLKSTKHLKTPKQADKQKSNSGGGVVNAFVSKTRPYCLNTQTKGTDNSTNGGLGIIGLILAELDAYEQELKRKADGEDIEPVLPKIGIFSEFLGASTDSTEARANLTAYTLKHFLANYNDARIRNLKVGFILGSTTPQERSSTIHSFNEGGADGVRIVIFSKAGAEGVDYKKMRLLILMQPQWTVGLALQVKGRAVRLGSMPAKGPCVKIVTLVAKKDPSPGKPLPNATEARNKKAAQDAEDCKNIKSLFVAMVFRNLLIASKDLSPPQVERWKTSYKQREHDEYAARKLREFPLNEVTAAFDEFLKEQSEIADEDVQEFDDQRLERIKTALNNEEDTLTADQVVLRLFLNKLKLSVRYDGVFDAIGLQNRMKYVTPFDPDILMTAFLTDDERKQMLTFEGHCEVPHHKDILDPEPSGMSDYTKVFLKGFHNAIMTTSDYKKLIQQAVQIVHKTPIWVVEAIIANYHANRQHIANKTTKLMRSDTATKMYRQLREDIVEALVKSNKSQTVVDTVIGFLLTFELPEAQKKVVVPRKPKPKAAVEIAAKVAEIRRRGAQARSHLLSWGRRR